MPDLSAKRLVFLLGRGVLGGVERHVLALARHLDRSRFSPAALILYEDGPVGDALRAQGVEVRALCAKAAWDPRVLLGAGAALAALRPQVVHAHELHRGTRSAMRGAGSARWVQTEHCSFEHGPSPARAAKLWRAMHGRMDAILAVSNPTAESLCRHTGLPRERVHVIPNGIDLSLLPARDPACLRRAAGWPDNAIVIGTVGRLVPQKGMDDFIRLASLIAAREPLARFAVIGGGPYREALEWQAREAGLGDLVWFAGSRTDAVALIGGMDVFVMASHHEELPTTLLEAMAMGTPVAGFLPEGGTTDILSAAGERCIARLLPERDMARLAEAILSIPGDPAARAMTTAAGETVREVFDMRDITRRVQVVYSGASGLADGRD